MITHRFSLRLLSAAIALFLVVSVALGKERELKPLPPIEQTSCSNRIEKPALDELTIRARSDVAASFWLAQYYVVCEGWNIDDDAETVRSIVDWYVLAFRSDPRLITYDALTFLAAHFSVLEQTNDREVLTKAIWEAGIQLQSVGVDDFLEAAVCAQISGALQAFENFARSGKSWREFTHYKLGNMFKKGECVTADRTKAIFYFQECIGVGGNSCGHELIGIYDLQPFSREEEAFYLRTDISDRKYWLSRAVRRGSKVALPVLEEVARSGDYFAAYELGKLYHGRDAIEQRPKIAAIWYESCAAEFSLCGENLLELIVSQGFATNSPHDFARMAIGVIEHDNVANYPPGIDDLWLFDRILDVAPTIDNKRKAAKFFYHKAARPWRMTGPKRMALVERALVIDPDPTRFLRAAHTLYEVANLNGNVRAAAVSRSAKYFARAGEEADALGQARYAALQLLAKQGFDRGDDIENALTRSAALGSKAARNTLGWLTSLAKREFSKVEWPTTEEHSDLCVESGDRLPVLLRRHFRQARQLMALRSGPPPVTPKDVSSLIGQLKDAGGKTALLVYGRGWDGHCVWLLDKDGVQAFEKVYAPPNSILEDLRRLYSELGVPEDRTQRAALRGSASKRGLISWLFGPSRAERVETASLSLSRLLLPGRVAEVLPSYQYVYIAPFGAVGSVPFSLLKTASGDYASDRTSFIVLAGLSEIPIHLRRANQRRWRKLDGRVATAPRDQVRSMSNNAHQTILVLGNPRPPAPLGMKFVNLPGAEEEAKSVAKLLGTMPYLRERATTEVLTDRGKQAKILYFAGHAVAAASTPNTALDSSYLVTASGKWTARQIQAESFKANIAVLSACQTGLGFEHPGGTIGLSRAFAIAGVPRVVMSLWSVNDEATAYLMTEFMRLSKNLNYMDALREAIQKSRKKYKHPALWAGFTFFAADINSFNLLR